MYSLSKTMNLSTVFLAIKYLSKYKNWGLVSHWCQFYNKQNKIAVFSIGFLMIVSILLFTSSSTVVIWLRTPTTKIYSLFLTMKLEIIFIFNYSQDFSHEKMPRYNLGITWKLSNFIDKCLRLLMERVNWYWVSKNYTIH